MDESIAKAFTRQGDEVHLSELRAGTSTIPASLSTGAIAGAFLSIVPWLLQVLMWLAVRIIPQLRTEYGERWEIDPFAEYVANSWSYAALLAVAGAVGALLRRYSARHNQYLVLTIGSVAELRASYGYVIAAVGITGSLCLLSETARFFSILTAMLALLAAMVWEDVQGYLLRWLARVSHNHSAETIYSVWTILKCNDNATGARIEAIGAADKGKTLLITGFVPEADPARELIEGLPDRVIGLERVQINPQVKTGSKRNYTLPMAHTR